MAYHAINGKHCYIHPRLGIPLPSRATLSGSVLWDNTLHRNFERLPTNKRDDALPFAHSNFKKSTAYAKIPHSISHIQNNIATAFYDQHLSSGECLIWFLGRPDDDGSSSAPFWKIDTIPDGVDEDGNAQFKPLAPRKRVQSILQRHLMDSIMNIYLDDRYHDTSTFASPRDCVSNAPIQLLQSYKPMSKERRSLMYTSLTGAKTGWSLFHLSNRPNWELRNSRTFWHAMDMKFQRFLKEYRELRIHCNERSHLGFCPGATHAGAAHANARQNARGGRCLNNCTKGGKYALHDTLQNALVKALNGDNIKAVAIEAHPYSTETNRTDISISSAETPDIITFLNAWLSRLYR